MSIQEIIQAIITLIAMITGKITELKAAAEEATKELRSIRSRMSEIEERSHDLYWRGPHKVSNLKDEIDCWKSPELQALLKAQYASETFCRKTLGEIKRLTKLAEDQENSRKGDPFKASYYRAQIEELRAQRKQALEVLAKKEARAERRANSLEEAAAKAKAVADLQKKLDQYIADHAEQIAAYDQVKTEEDQIIAEYNKVYDRENDLYMQIRKLERSIDDLEGIKDLAERSIKLTDRAKNDDDLEWALDLEQEAQDRFEDKYLDQYLEIA